MSRAGRPCRVRARHAALALAVAAAALASSAGAAHAHVTLVPSAAPAGAYAVFDVRVPNERDDAATTRVDVQLPPGVVHAAFHPVPGWDVRVFRERLEPPLETADGPISEQVARVAWRGDGSAAGRIPPGGFVDFPLSLKLPDEEGETLAFKALQTYDSGEVVRWIGEPGAPLPAARVVLGSPAGEGDGAGAGHGGGEGRPAARGPAPSGSGAAPAPEASAAASDDGVDGLAAAGLIVGCAGLAAGGLALARGRR